jgi:hypothetical protein
LTLVGSSLVGQRKESGMSAMLPATLLWLRFYQQS